MTNIVSAQPWSERKAHQESKVEASIGFRGGRDLTFNDVTSERMNFSLSNGFEVMGCYRPLNYVFFGGVLTNYANSNSGVDNPGSISQTQLGLIGFIATPWAQLSTHKKKRSFHYRAKIGGVLDASGLEVKGMDNSQNYFTLGRLREHRFFVSTELGAKIFDSSGTAMFFLRLSYMRSIYSFSGNNISMLEFESGNNDRIVFDIGISL